MESVQVMISYTSGRANYYSLEYHDKELLEVYGDSGAGSRQADRALARTITIAI
jgi:hypothetical protein